MTDLFNDNGAEFSGDRKYRYSLWRIWDKSKPLIMFIGLNPSIANESKNDPTMRRIMGFADSWGYGGVYMMNCFAYVSDNPKNIKYSADVDEFNMDLIPVIAEQCKDVVFAWGACKAVKESGWDTELIEMFPNAKCLKKNKDGSPIHPLYVKGDTKLINFK